MESTIERRANVSWFPRQEDQLWASRMAQWVNHLLSRFPENHLVEGNNSLKCFLCSPHMLTEILILTLEKVGGSGASL